MPAGARGYAETKRRQAVPFDADLRALTEATARALADVFAARMTPPPTEQTSRCRACSLAELCRPNTVVRPAPAWRRRMVAALVAGAAALDPPEATP